MRDRWTEKDQETERYFRQKTCDREIKRQRKTDGYTRTEIKKSDR